MSSKNMGNVLYSWVKAYNEIKTRHDEAFRAIDQAISLEERERPNEAISKYKEGIRLIDEALAVQVQCPEDPDPTWEKACSMIKKIKQTRAEVLLRINCIQGSPNFVQDLPEEDPPSYDEAIASSASSGDETPRTYRDLARALNELSIDPNQSMQEEIIYTHENVRLYFISPNGEVVSTLEPQTMRILAVQSQEPNAPKAILQIGTFVYPLVPGVSPCYRTNYGAFILPDLNSVIPRSSVGLILPSDADDEVFDLLENILHGVISQTTDVEQPEEYSTKVSNRIVDGAFRISQGLIRGAMKTGDYLNRTTPKLIDSINGADQPTNVPKPLSKTMKIAEKTTSTAANVTGFVAEKVGYATVRLGRFLAPHIQKQGTRLLTGFNMSEEEASRKVRDVLTVTAGAVEGFSTVYAGLETSASILGRNLKDNTVKIVHHRYGQPASTLTDDTLSTVGNVYHLAHNAKYLTPKGLAKCGLRDTGKAVVQDFGSSKRASAAYQTMVSTTSGSEKPEVSCQNTVTDDFGSSSKKPSMPYQQPVLTDEGKPESSSGKPVDCPEDSSMDTSETESGKWELMESEDMEKVNKKG